MPVIRRSQRPARTSAGTSVSAKVYQVKRADDSTSRQIAFTDEFLATANRLGAQIVLQTPYNVGRLFELIDQSNMVRQCIDAYVTNTVMAGWETADILRGRAKTEVEHNELQSFIDNANSEQSLSTVMAQVLRDRESVGFGFLEVIRDLSDYISLLRWAPALSTRLCAKHQQEVLVEYDIPRGKRSSTVKEFRRFRRFVQVVNGRMRFFKEFGDPRRMDYETGAFEGEDGYNPARRATELIHFKLPSNDAYGVPRWINQLPSIIGSREAEEVNMRYFQDNTVPPLMLIVGGGRLSAHSHRELSRALNSDIGTDRQNKVLLLEAIGEGDSLDGKTSNVTLKVEKMTDARQSDGLFNQYDEANMAKVRSSFRLPPVLVGQSQDVTFATANVSAFVAETQVFLPMRNEIDEILNKLLVNGRRGMNLKSCKLVSRAPIISSPDQVLKTLTALNVMGALTPRRAQTVANALLQLEMEPFPEKGKAGHEDWMDQPMPLTLRDTGAANKDDSGDPPPENTHTEQQGKDAETKDTEATGNINKRQPKNGAQ